MTNPIGKSLAFTALGAMLAGLSACASTTAAGPGAEPAPAGKKQCCAPGKNECAGKGNCHVEGVNACRGQNQCRGKGGCKPADCGEDTTAVESDPASTPDAPPPAP